MVAAVTVILAMAHTGDVAVKLASFYTNSGV